MDIVDLWKIARRRWRIIGLSVVCALGGSIALSATSEPLYEAKARVFVVPSASSGATIAQVLDQIRLSDAMLASFGEIIRSRPLVENVMSSSQGSVDPEVIVKRIRTRIIPDTRIVEVSFTDRTPAGAQTFVRDLVVEFISRFEKDLGGKSIGEAVLLEPPQLPRSPVRPQPLRDAALAGVLGLVIGGFGAAVRERLDTTLRDPADVERATGSSPLLAAIPRTRTLRRRKPTSLRANGKVAEAFRTLRTAAQASPIGDGALNASRPRERSADVRVVVSPYPGDGRTTVAIHLAETLALGGQQTLLIDADMREPSLHAFFGLDPAPGLSDVLLGGVPTMSVVQKTSVPGLLCITAGSPHPDPSGLLAGEQIGTLFHELRQAVDAVIIDTPPALSLPDAILLAAHTSGALMVVRSGVTHREGVVELTRALERLDKPVGVILNEAHRAEAVRRA